ncbi:gamma-glutamyltransferase [Neofamilia massiliensis]|uniref:gamma-glutamyltransferase n=1 Tax=Neofamilia massiliensis TaxID=1673724 RepID=UPI0006BB5FFA|nr:gamma-glutamyltransferase [Neofamilia massiliensis]
MKFNFDSLSYSYPSRRNVVFSKNGMVATGNPLAAQAGLEILKKGGNAIDAAIATASTLSVVEPTGNGVGGDAFAIIWYKGKLYGMNSSGRSPKNLNPQDLIDKGYTKVPSYGVIPITVPGIPSAWSSLVDKFGKLELKDVLKPAINYARDGFTLQPNVSKLWKAAYDKYKIELEKDNIFKYWYDTFAPNGACPKAGDLFKNPFLADSLEEIAETNSDSFYRGNLAKKIVTFLQENGSAMELSDFNNFETEYVEPISTNFEGYDVFELPPNGHGISVLMALNILKHLDIKNINSFESIHKQIEAMKLAFVDAQKYVTDPNYMSVSISDLLSDDYSKQRASLITDTALTPEPSDIIKGGTVYMAAADNEGNMVSYIQSNYMGFGSGVVVPETGISLHNRGANFSLDPNHDNFIQGGKKPYHTIIPGFLMKDKKPVGPFGIMGGFMQPQAHLQVLLSTIINNCNPQDALDKPRWQWTGGKTIEVEPGFDNNIAQQLMRAGHDVITNTQSTNFGRGEIIWRNDEDVLCGATEPRTDGCVAAW